MRILAILHNFNWEYNNHIKTLQDMGHDVIWYDWGKFGFNQYEPEWLLFNRSKFNTHIIEFCIASHTKKPIDLFFSHLSDPMIDLNSLKEIKDKLNCPMVNFAWNDYTAFDKYINSCDGYDLNWTCIKASTEFYRIADVSCKYIPPGINPTPYLHYDKEHEYMRDISFIGQQYGYRKKILENLSQYISHSYSSKITFNGMINQIYSSKINLGFCGFHKIDNDVKQLRLRDFEVPVCNGFYLTEYCGDLIELFEENKEIVTYKTEEELVEKINYYLKYDKKREIIKNNAHTAVMTRHKWEFRFKELFNILGLKK